MAGISRGPAAKGAVLAFALPDDVRAAREESERRPASAAGRSRLGFIRLGGARQCRRDDQIPAREQFSPAASPLQVPGCGGPMRCHAGEILGWHEEPLLVTLEEPARRGPEALLAIGL